jgi:hypothetical protein
MIKERSAGATWRAAHAPEVRLRCPPPASRVRESSALRPLCAASRSSDKYIGSRLEQGIGRGLDAVHPWDGIEDNVLLFAGVVRRDLVQTDCAERQLRTILGPADGGIVNDVNILGQLYGYAKPDRYHSVDDFPARTTGGLLEFLNALIATDPAAPHPNAIEQFLGAHPAALTFVQIPKPIPTSFAKGGHTRSARHLSLVGEYTWLPLIVRPVPPINAATLVPTAHSPLGQDLTRPTHSIPLTSAASAHSPLRMCIPVWF